MSFGNKGIFFWLILIILIAVIIYLVVQNRNSKLKEQRETPLEILKKRYAKGEITKEEFKSIKKDLSE